MQGSNAQHTLASGLAGVLILPLSDRFASARTHHMSRTAGGTTRRAWASWSGRGPTCELRGDDGRGGRGRGGLGSRRHERLPLEQQLLRARADPLVAARSNQKVREMRDIASTMRTRACRACPQALPLWSLAATAHNPQVGGVDLAEKGAHLDRHFCLVQGLKEVQSALNVGLFGVRNPLQLRADLIHSVGVHRFRTIVAIPGVDSAAGTIESAVSVLLTDNVHSAQGTMGPAHQIVKVQRT